MDIHGSSLHVRKRASNFDVLPTSLQNPASASSSSAPISELQATINAITANAIASGLSNPQILGAPPTKFKERVDAALLKNFEYIQRFPISLYKLTSFFCL